MLSLNFAFLIISALLVVDCRQTSFRYQLFGSSSLATTTTTVPTTAAANSQQSLINHPKILNHKTKPYNIYLENGLEYILPMLGKTKPTSTTPPSTTPLAINPLESLRQRTGNRFCVDKTTCPYCPYEGNACCYKHLNKGLNVRGECRCVTKPSDLNKCD